MARPPQGWTNCFMAPDVLKAVREEARADFARIGRTLHFCPDHVRDELARQILRCTRGYTEGLLYTPCSYCTSRGIFASTPRAGEACTCARGGSCTHVPTIISHPRAPEHAGAPATILVPQRSSRDRDSRSIETYQLEGLRRSACFEGCWTRGTGELGLLAASRHLGTGSAAEQLHGARSVCTREHESDYERALQ